MAHRKQILVLESDKLLTAAISKLLASRSEFEVTNTTASSLACLGQTGDLQADVVILDEGQLAANISDVIQLAAGHPKLRLIVFGLNDTKVHIFDKQIVQVTQVSDLLALL